MVDYTRSTGDNGTMMIRDIQGKIQFWLRAASPVGGKIRFRATINGRQTDYIYDFQTGGEWQRLGQWTVDTTQTVAFYLYQTAGPSLGGPTNLSAYIDRNTVPEEPTIKASSITGRSVTISISDGDSNGGDPIDVRQIVWRLPSETELNQRTLPEGTKQSTFNNLNEGALYYFWARTHNRHGWSTYGPRINVQLYDQPEQPGVVRYSEITQTSVKTTFTDGDNNGTAIIGRQVGYSLSSTGDPTTVVTYSGPTVVTGLKPATKYYFRSRTRNSVGWGAWSSVSSFTTLSGVRINVNGVWRHAIPYVKVNGVWRLARPWGRQFGYWEETT